jgi:hypothetical protein
MEFCFWGRCEQMAGTQNKEGTEYSAFFIL